jgi:hypothetical protein
VRRSRAKIIRGLLPCSGFLLIARLSATITAGNELEKSQDSPMNTFQMNSSERVKFLYAHLNCSFVHAEAVPGIINVHCTAEGLENAAIF